MTRSLPIGKTPEQIVFLDAQYIVVAERVMVASDGSLVVTKGKGHGTGTDGKPYGYGDGDITRRMRGSIQHVAAALLADLAAQSATL